MGKHGDTMRDRILKWALPIGMSPTFSLLQQGARRTAAGDAAWCHFAAREYTVLPWGCTPHFLFETSKRKCAVHGGKEKMSGMSWPLCRSTHPKTEVGRFVGQLTPKRRLAATHCRLNLKRPYRLRYTQISNQCVPAPESPSHTGVANRTSSASLSTVAPPSFLGRNFQRGKHQSAAGGRIKRGAFEEMARLAAHQGRESYRRDGVRWRPPCFGWGSKGEGALRQRLLPLAP